MYDLAVSSVKRSYDGRRRQARAAETRREVLDAAGELFGSRGYSATSVDEVAAAAMVSRETVFKSFGSKRELLRQWVERELAGPDEPVAIADQHWVQEIRDSPDRGRRIEIAAAAVGALNERAIDALMTLRAASHSDPEIAELWQLACEQRRRDVVAIARLVFRDALPRGRARTELYDVIFALTGPEMIELLVRQCGWTIRRYSDWLAEVFTRSTSSLVATT